MKFLPVAFILLAANSGFAQRTPLKEFPWITISQIADCKSDTFLIKAKVVELYTCPPCPPGAICKPCIGNHLTVEDTDAAEPLRSLVFVKSTEEFKKDGVYIFTLVLQNKSHPDFGSNL